MKILFSALMGILVLTKSCKSVEDVTTVTNNNASSLRILTSDIKPLWNRTFLDKLRKDLLTNYDKYARPAEHLEVTNLQIGITILHLETDEINSTISVSAWLKLLWTDPKLKWNKDDYGGLDSIKLAEHEVWQPDIGLYNSALTSETVTRYGTPNAVVYSNGKVLLVPPSRFLAICAFDLYYWPFDKQNCKLKFMSWSLSAHQLKLDLFKHGLGETDESRSIISPWDVEISGETYRKYHPCCPAPFHTAEFNLSLTRKSSSYAAVVIIPVIVIMALIIMQCCMDCGSERIILGSCTTLMTIILLSHFIPKVTNVGGDTPWIIRFYSTCLYLSTFSMIQSILIRIILKSEHKKSIPNIIQSTLKGRLGRLLLLENRLSETYNGLRRPTEEELRDYHLSEQENDVIIKSKIKDSIRLEWEVFAVALNRILLWIYCFIFLILILCYAI